MPLTGASADLKLLHWLCIIAMLQAASWSLFTAPTSALCAALHTIIAHNDFTMIHNDFTMISSLIAPVMIVCTPVHSALPYKFYTPITCRLSWPLRCQTTLTAVATPHGRLTYRLVLSSLQPASPVSTMPRYSSYTVGSPHPLHSIPVRRPANSCTRGAAFQSRANEVLMSVAAS